MKSKKFIIPLVFSLDDYDFAPDLYARPFYNFLYFAYKNKLPIIIQERYIADPEKMKKNETTKWYFDEWSMKQFGYEYIDKEEIEKIDKYVIGEKITEKICKPFKNQSEAFLDILKKKNTILERVLIGYIDEIEKKYNKKIDAFMVWVNNKTVEKVCKDRNIKLIQMEMGPVRNLDWATTIAYCMDRDKYDNDFVKEEYELFKKEVPNQEILTKDELLALFLKEEDSRYLFEKSKTPEYEFGVALSFPEDYFFNLHSNFSNEEIYRKILNLVDNRKISVRSHPGSKYNLGKNPNYDGSLFSKDFVVKCGTVVSGVSNINFQAMLFDRKSITVSDKMPWSFLDGGDLDYVPGSSVDAKFLNYLVFCYFSPLREMFDIDYLDNKIFGKRDLYDLCKKNRKIIFEKRGLKENIIKLSPRKRLEKIVSTCFSNDVYHRYIDYTYEKELKAELNSYENRYSSIINSKGYKYLTKIWNIKGRLKK